MESLSQQCGILLVIFISIFLAGFVPFAFASPVTRRFRFDVSLMKKVPHLFGCIVVVLLFLMKMDVFVWLLAFLTEKYHFVSYKVEWKKVTRLCHTKQLLTVNGQYPGPTIAVHEGDTVEIKVNNCINENTTIHW